MIYAAKVNKNKKISKNILTEYNKKTSDKKILEKFLSLVKLLE